MKMIIIKIMIIKIMMKNYYLYIFIKLTFYHFSQNSLLVIININKNLDLIKILN